MKRPSIVKKTFQSKMILYNFLVVICIAVAISFYNCRSYQQDAVQAEIKNASDRMQILSARVETAFNEMVNIVLACSERKSLFSATAADSVVSSQNPSIKIFASDILRDYCAISGYNRYINKLILYNNGQVLQAGKEYGVSTDVSVLQTTDWFYELLSREASPYLLSLKDNPFFVGRTNTPKILPLVRPLKYGYNEKLEDAWIFLSISPELFTSSLENMPPSHIIYAAAQDGTIIASVNGGQFDTDEVTAMIRDCESTSGNFSVQLNDSNCIISYYKQQISGLMFFEILPSRNISLDYNIIKNTIIVIFLFCIAIGLSLSLLISHQLGAPIHRLMKRLDQVAKGDFTTDLSIETNDEIGMIGKHLNQMSHQISNLMDTRIQNEKEKKDLEIKMLQAQINPHFLYNTLDSIKWIATLQNNSGIVQVVTALSSLLKNMAKGFNEKVTLQQELDFLNHYVVIEKVRYIGLFDVDIEVDDPRLYQARIIKLTLQPIVENAIFNGIEPSGRTGLIRIHAYAADSTLYIDVSDNGIGIEPENIEKLLTDTSRITRSNMNGIGLPNVDRRLKLVYGSQYGLTIKSEIGRYTTITISLPLEYED